jgi:hypothetical protein
VFHHFINAYREGGEEETLMKREKAENINQEEQTKIIY